MSVLRVEIRPDQRVFFCGRTGSGKTTLARRYLGDVPRFVVLDPKHTFTFPGVKPRPAFDKRLDRQIIRVPIEHEPWAWERVMMDVWKRGNTLIYADELTLVEPKTLEPSAALGRVIRTGRERGVGFWSATQRPSLIPGVVYTESEHFFVFQLTFERDRNKVASFTGDAMIGAMERLKGHDFAYYNVLTATCAVARQPERK